MKQVECFNLFCLLALIFGQASASPRLDRLSECKMVAVDLNGLMVTNPSPPSDYASYLSSTEGMPYLRAEYGVRIKHASTTLLIQGKTIGVPSNHSLRSTKWFESLDWTGKDLNFPVGLAPRKVGVFLDGDNPGFCWIVELYDKNAAIMMPGSVCADGLFQILPNAKVAFLRQSKANSISELMGLK